MTFHIISILPDSFGSYLNQSILGRATRAGKIKIKIYDLRQFVLPTKGGRRQVDGRPFGGGPGMIIAAPAVIKAVESIKRKVKSSKLKIIFFSVSGKQFDQRLAIKLSRNYQHIILIAGRYEGVDARAAKILQAEEVSIGPYILSGGELPAMIVIDAVARQISGVLGNGESLEEARTASTKVYTRPEVLIYKGKKYRVPKVLLSGHHAKIEEWRGSDRR